MGPELCILAMETDAALVTPMRVDEILASVAPAIALPARAKNVKCTVRRPRYPHEEGGNARSITSLNPEEDLQEAKHAKAPMEKKESPGWRGCREKGPLGEVVGTWGIGGWDGLERGDWHCRHRKGKKDENGDDGDDERDRREVFRGVGWRGRHKWGASVNDDVWRLENEGKDGLGKRAPLLISMRHHGEEDDQWGTSMDPS
ncbi:hypothetical protein H4582DRAFT_2058809 [Lactarius indigo]|nr:hypothetical protein H4582DRAFT_2058809 [Lactarius indigo]